MKKAVSLIVAMVLLIACLPLGIVTHAAAQEVTLSEGGSLADALAEVANGGTIKVDGTVAVTKALGTHKKTVTITGGTLDFSGFSGNLSLGDHITFENITLNFAESDEGSSAPAILCNGYKVKIGEGVEMPNPIRIFGGKNGGTVASTNLTLLSGYYTQIWGGGSKGDVIGDVNLYVGGNVNATIDETSHNKTACIFGGGFIPSDTSNTIGGTVHMVFTGNARANYIYGGNAGLGSGTINGSIDMTVSGGSVMSVYGGSQGGSLTSDVKLLISGGSIEQVFGGCEGNSLTGDVEMDITGGTITRRVYGGCYNNYDGSWKTAHYVTGNIVLALHRGANVTTSSNSDDKGLYAHSRQGNLSDTEVTHLLYADSTAYTKYKDKVGGRDWGARYVMGSSSAADYIHYHTYSASSAVITQSCIDSKCSATATLTADKALYTGSAVKPAKVVYAGNWFGGDLAIKYTNNVEPGIGTATITCGGATASANFEVSREAGMYMNGVGYASLEDAIAAAKKTSGPDTITLYEDVNVTSWLAVNTEVTLKAEEAITISAADTQTGSMIRVTGRGKLTIEGASEDAKLTLAAGVKTTNVIANNGGEINLTNVCLRGNKNTTHTRNNKACGIFNDDGTVNAKSVDIADMVMGDGIYALKGTTVNLDNVTVSGSGRYGIKVSGTVNIYNTVRSDHALSVSNTVNNAIDVENSGNIISHLENVPEGTHAILLFDNAKKDINVRGNGNAALTHMDEANTDQ